MLVAGCGRVQSHLVQREADLPAGVLALVQRCHVQITALIAGGAGRLALHVGFEQVEFAACAHLALVAVLLNGLHGLPQIAAQVALVGGAVHAVQGAEKPNHSAGLRPPRQDGERGDIRLQQKILVGRFQQICGVEGNAVHNGTVQLPGHDCNIFHVAERITKCQTNELDIVFLNEF